MINNLNKILDIVEKYSISITKASEKAGFGKNYFYQAINAKHFILDKTALQLLLRLEDLKLYEGDSPYLLGNPDNVLIISDTQIPFTREGAIPFLRKQQIKWDCGTVVHIGDVIDSHATTFHDPDPDGRSPGDELDVAVNALKEWSYYFPEVKVCIGNHDERALRKAYGVSISKRWMRDYSEVLELPGWTFAHNHEIKDVYYTHGSKSSGPRAAITKAINRRQSVVQGHIHPEATIHWNVSKIDRIFGMIVGSLMDDDNYASAYAKDMPKKSIVSCGVVIDGKFPHIIPMEL